MRTVGDKYQAVERGGPELVIWEVEKLGHCVFRSSGMWLCVDG
jgi:hypothetical protein